METLFSLLIGFFLFGNSTVLNEDGYGYSYTPSSVPDISEQQKLLEKSTLAKAISEREKISFLFGQKNEIKNITWGEENIDTNFLPMDSFPEKKQDSCLFPSPDGKKCISFDEYCHGEGHLFLEELPQKEIAMMEFCGTSCRYLGAEWISPEIFAIAKEQKQDQPTYMSSIKDFRNFRIEFYNLQTKTKNTFSTLSIRELSDDELMLAIDAHSSKFSKPFSPLFCPEKP